VEIASLFLKYFRDETIIRFGGDEFIIFSKEENKNILINKMNLIRKEFKTKIDKTTLNISYGISEINSDIENSIIEADSKMYLMKNKDDSS
jgi:diguanylate cyclase (GGDEF)-like protein